MDKTFMAKIVEQDGLYELADSEGLDASLSNADILPTPIKERSWNKWHIASLWIGMSVCIPTYMLAAQMIMGGLSWKEALMMILLGNVEPWSEISKESRPASRAS